MIARGKINVDALVSAVAPLSKGAAWFNRGTARAGAHELCCSRAIEGERKVTCQQDAQPVYQPERERRRTTCPITCLI